LILKHAMIVKTIVWPDENATQAFAQALARRPELRNAQIELRGDLGAGKTTFVRHLLTALGVQGRIKSPTYAVVEPYELGGASGPVLLIWHFDFYRFNDPDEWEEAGFRDIFASPGLKLVEWAANAGPHLPPADLVMAIQTTDTDTRHVGLTALSDVGAGLLS
jgi:tRNA threonylcarbamoyladenosine biosynthesis protein TsaE